MARRGRRLAAALAVCAVVGGSLAVAGCGDDDSSDSSTGAAASGLSGNITIDGSSTVEPLSSAAAEAFNADNPDVNISVGSSGTGGGFEVFCKGETDISDASRAIKDDEVAACEAGGVTFEEFRVASDGITLVTGKDTDVGGDNLTVDQLAAIWGPDSKIKNWDQVPPAGSFSSQAMALAGPDSQSGTYDFFNEEVLGEDSAGETISPRQDYTASADDNVIVRAVQSAPGTLGFFGYTYFEENTHPQGLRHRRRQAHGRHDHRRQLPALASAVHLREHGEAPAARGERFRAVLLGERGADLRGQRVRARPAGRARRVARQARQLE